MRNDFPSASDHGNPAEIAVSMPKETTSKGMGGEYKCQEVVKLQKRNFGNFWIAPRNTLRLI